MRLWTLHPRYLDARGLVALWREGLLARHVLLGATRGYRNHPQLERFRAHATPVVAIDEYLRHVYAEACRRGYAFDVSKLGAAGAPARMDETTGQLAHEWSHLLEKLRIRAPEAHRALGGIARPDAHPLFRIVPGPVRSWERSGMRTPVRREMPRG
jgi:hypothetical protein